MVPHSLNVAHPDGESQILWEDGERVFRRGWRLDHEGKQRAVLIVAPADDHPSRSSLDRLTHEYELRDELDATWAVLPLDLVRDAGRTELVLEDEGARPVDRLFGAPMDLGRFLHIGIAAVFALGRLHQRGLVHKDIKPANIMFNEATGEVRLTGFGIASRFARERQPPHPPETIVGTLAYMAPEQTGRMNRSVDSRSDLYALGVTFYQMLTGSLPFAAVDPVEWVHCHLARQPVPPPERRKEIPTAVSAIVMKLLAKRAEDRYQTAAGLESDLRICLCDWAAQRSIRDFLLGERDRADRLLIPEKLYGRQGEVETLLAAFDRVINDGSPELVLVSGYSGIGKSSVVNELQPVLVPPRGLFASGKFDQYKRDIPYATLAQAFQGLIRPLLGKSEGDLALWREALQRTLGSNAGLMVDLVPELKLLIGEPPPVVELPPQDAQRRFQMVLRQFVGVFARPEHPLALFLDDLQWLDAATLDLLQDLLSRPDLGNLLLIGAFRDNEVTAAHPLLQKLETMRATGRVRDIRLVSLRTEDLALLVADTLRCDTEQAAPLASLVYAKTDGNPFFVIQFLQTLADEGLLAFDHERARWSWDLGAIHAKRYTDNVVELLAGKLTRLSSSTADALRQLACLGNIADVARLSIVLEMPEDQVHAALADALHQQLIDRVGPAYKFAHDRVQEAAYALMPEISRAEEHLRIGRLLLAQIPSERRDETIFEIVNHLNRGVAFIESQEERERLAELNLRAGKRAKASSAYASALAYLSMSEALLPEDGWQRRHDLAFELQLDAFDCELCTGALQDAEKRIAALEPRSVGTIQRCVVARRRVDLYTMLGMAERAVAVALECLAHVGIVWSAHPGEAEARLEYERVRSRLGSRAIEDLINLPLMEDPEILATLDVLTSLGVPALATDLDLYALSVCRSGNLNLEHGNSDTAPAAYVSLGLITSLCFSHHDEGYRFGRMGCDLLERCGLNHGGGRTYFLFAVLVPWTKSLREGIDPARRSFQMAKAHGDPAFAAYACRAFTTIALASGLPLDQVGHEAEQGLEYVQGFGAFLDRVSAPLALIRTLRGRTVRFGSLDDRRFTERAFEERVTGKPHFGPLECYYWIRKLQARFFAGDYVAAVEAAGKAGAWYGASASMSFFMMEKLEYNFYGALARAALCESSDANTAHLEALRDHESQLRGWADTCPQNFEDRAALVGAEIARIEGRTLAAMELYERAIAAARTSGFVQHEALACEVAGRFYAGRGLKDIAHLYVRNARQGYLRWGAEGKVRQLDQLHPWLRPDNRAAGGAGTIEAAVEHLDVATFIEVSQALSGEMDGEKLVDRLMRAAVAEAGAERAVLVAVRGEELRTSAEAVVRGDELSVQVRQHPSRDAVALPDSLILYSIRAREPVILDDALVQNPFSTDPYVLKRRLRSVLCLPLINQGRLIAILYLENNLTPHVFTPSRVTILKVLASQAAISLENTALYRDLADRDAKIRRLVDSNIIGIFFARQGRILEANDAFLRILGYDREDMAWGRIGWADLSPPEWRERDLLTRALLDTTGVVPPFEKEYFRKDGSRVPVLIGAALVTKGAEEGVAFVIDLTERKRAEEALRESERRLRSAIDGIPGLVASLAPNGDVEAVNRQILEYCGASLEEMKNWGTNGTIHQEDLPHLTEVFTKSIAAGVPYETAARIRRFDGAYRWFDIRGIPVRDASNGISGWYALLTDIEDRTQALARLQQMQSDFARMNRVSMMGELAASLSHEIAQPIASARNNARAAQNFLKMQPPDLGEVREALSCVVADADRSGAIIDRIREQIKKAPPRKERFDLNAAIDEVIVLARSVTLRNGVSVQTRLAEGLLSVLGDRVQVQQVLLNLILNAAEAMGSAAEGTRELLIGTEHDQTGARVAVRDSGPGIDPGRFDRVFDAFYTTKSGGTGMGLSICRSIIHAHGGKLWVEANEPRGAVFQFTLPDAERELTTPRRLT